jgi:N-acetylglucosamine-6-sulfatase
MWVRLVGVLALAGAALMAAAPGSAVAADRAAGKPNIVVVMTDDQSVSDMRAMPNVRRLIARQGTSFRNSFSSYPLCCPARATYLTGQYAHNHGVGSNFPPGGFYGLRRQGNTLPVWLKRAGYVTGHSGKFLNQYGAKDPTEVPPGWDEWYGTIDFSTYDYFNYLLNENGRVTVHGDEAYARGLSEVARATQDGELNSPADLFRKLDQVLGGNLGTERAQDYSTDVLADRAARFIRRRAPGRKPFFLTFTPVAPHREDLRNILPNAPQTDPRPAPRHADEFANVPLPRGPAFNEADMSDKPSNMRALPLMSQATIDELVQDHRGRLRSLQAVDEAVARFVAELRRAGELDNTLIIFTSDNGWLQGQHRVPDNKYLAYEPSIRVPLVMRGPGVPAGRTISATAINVDLPATVVDAAGARPGRTLDGISLLPVVRHPRRAPKRDVLLEALEPLFDRPGFPHEESQPYYGIRTNTHKYVRWRTGEEELYDLRRDPHELQSLAADPSAAALKRRLAARARRLSTCRGANCR